MQLATAVCVVYILPTYIEEQKVGDQTVTEPTLVQNKLH